MLIQKEPRLEFAECVLICRSSTAERRQRYVCRHIALSEIRRWMENLLRRDRHVLVDDLARISLLEVSNEFRAAQIWKDQRLLNNERRFRKDGHRALIFANRLAHSVPSAGKIDRHVVAAEHCSDLLVHGLSLEHGLRG